MKCLILCVVSIVSVSRLFGQQAIKVIDRSTNLPVSYTTIKILNSALGTIATAEGIFALHINPGDSVLFTCAGYGDTILIGKEIGKIVYLNQKIIELKPVVIGTQKGNGTIVIGNDKKIQKGDIAYGLFSAKTDNPYYIGDVAQKIIIPESIRLLKINKIFIPVKRYGKCFGPLLLRVYLPDTIGSHPGTAILNRLITTESDLLIKNRLFSVNVSANNLFFNGSDSFFVSISWPPEAFNGGCGTTLLLSKSSDAESIYGSPYINSSRWVPFGKWKFLNGTEVEVKTFYSVEAEVFK